MFTSQITTKGFHRETTACVITVVVHTFLHMLLRHPCVPCSHSDQQRPHRRGDIDVQGSLETNLVIFVTRLLVIGAIVLQALKCTFPRQIVFVVGTSALFCKHTKKDNIAPVAIYDVIRRADVTGFRRKNRRTSSTPVFFREWSQ